MMEDLTKTIMFTTNTIQNGAPTTIQYQTADGTLKTPKIEGQKSQEFSTFCYTNVNKIQMLTPTTQGHASTVNLAQLTADDTKTCYIAQPFGYANYALVNQVPIGQGSVAGIATVDSNGRIQVVNKPITNTISNISFKCDVCGLMFSHLTLLNHHKRIHTQDGTDTGNDQQITVVTQGGQNLVQTGNIVNENGQSLAQIQIVATESLEPVQQHSNDHQQQQQQQQSHQQHQQHAQQQHQQQIHVSQQQQHQPQHQTHQQQQHQHQQQIKTITIEKGGNKCITCGVHIAQNKRKGPKLIRCENCISNDNASMLAPRQTQIFVAPDGDVKFEMSEIRDVDQMDMGSQNVIPIVTIAQPSPASSSQTISVKHQKTEQSSPGGSSNSAGFYPVKKRNLSAVTKCHKCNGSGLIFIGGHKNNKVPLQDKPFHCNICGGSFSRYSSLWSHKKLHSGEKNYKCTICGLAFAKAVYLKNHSRIHTGEKPYKCGTCGMQFSQSPHLKNHERTHSGEKPYVCEVCDKGFARHATLWNHRRIHTGEKPYKCEICGSAFSQAAHLKNHAKVHSGEKPFKCDICSAAFADRFALKRHRRIHEKYGQTAPRQPTEEEMIVHKEEIQEIDEDEETHNEVIISGI